MNSKIKSEIKQVTFIRVPPEKVFDALTTTEGLDGWFTSGAIVDLYEGGLIKFRWEKGDRPQEGVIEDGGPIIKINRPFEFVFQWQPDNSTYYTTVSLTFEKNKEGTLIRVSEKGFEDTPSGLNAMLGCAAGWGEALIMLKYYLEHGIKQNGHSRSSSIINE